MALSTNNKAQEEEKILANKETDEPWGQNVLCHLHSCLKKKNGLLWRAKLHLWTRSGITQWTNTMYLDSASNEVGKQTPEPAATASEHCLKHTSNHNNSIYWGLATARHSAKSFIFIFLLSILKNLKPLFSPILQNKKEGEEGWICSNTHD